jgi:protein ImuB
MVFRTRQREAQARDAVPLALVPPGLGLDPATRDALHKIGIDTVGELLALPREGLRERYGETAYQFHRTLHGATEAPLRPQVPVSPPRAVHDLEPPDDDSERLLFVARALLHPLLAESARRHEAVAALHLELQLELPKHAPRPVDAPGEPAPKPVVRERLQPAEATLQETLLVDLVRMRLQTLTLPARVERVAVELATVAASAAQLRLWQLAGRRDPEAVAGALARLRAAFGEGAVVRFKLRAAHLPEARFAGEPVAVLPEFEPPAPLLDTPRLDASDVPDPPPRLVRRMLPRATPLPARPKHEPDGWLLSDWRQGSVVRLWGPFRVTGGWWVREVRRDYHYVETESGELLWVYWDGVRRGWNLQGVVD